MICLIDDAEKYGLWGNTHEVCYETGYDGTPWMEKLFSMIERTAWIKSITLSEYLEKSQPRGLIYMPATSYDKITWWVLPTPRRVNFERLLKLAKTKKIEYSQDVLKFLKGGGFWRQFLVKYHEANNMHKKMMYVRDKLRWVEGQWGRDERTIKALREIYKAQNNDPYWHGQFGGVYFAFMRHNIYSYLIEAEKMIASISAEKMVDKTITPAVIPIDIDKDGREEILMETTLITMYLDPFRGGSVYEIDHKEKGVNILNAFQRRKEAYYRDDLEYVVDRWRRYAFYDHFIDEKVTLENLIQDTYEDLGNFLDLHYSTETKSGGINVSVSLGAEGTVKLEEKMTPVKISKFFELLENKDEIRIIITIENIGKTPIQTIHLTEIPIYISGEVENITFKQGKTESPILEDESFSAKDLQIYSKQNDVKMKITLDKSTDIFKYNLFTYVSTNGGDDTLYQGTVLAFKTPIDLDPEASASWRMSITLG